MKRYYSLTDYYRKAWGNSGVRKITVDAGFSCPNRDGKISFDGCIFCNNEGFSPNAGSKGLNPDFSIEKSARRAATYQIGTSGVNPAIGGATHRFCNSIAKYGLKLSELNKIRPSNPNKTYPCIAGRRNNNQNLILFLEFWVFLVCH
jgi:hypothetical protein